MTPFASSSSIELQEHLESKFPSDAQTFWNAAPGILEVIVKHLTSTGSYVAVIPDCFSHARHAFEVASPLITAGLLPLMTHWHQP